MSVVFKGSTFRGGRFGKQWTPSDLTNLELWLDASDNSTVLNSISPDTPATDGQAVRRWLDKSGNDRHANQTTGANQPLLDADGLNSNGVLTFDGINDLMTAGSIGDFNYLHDGTTSLVVVVFKVEPANPDTAYRIVGTLNDTISNTQGYFLNYDDRSLFTRSDLIATAVGSAVANNPVVDLLDNDVFLSQQFQIIEHEIDANNATASLRSIVKINGALQNGNNTSTGAVITGNSLTNLGIGASQTPSTFLEGAIAEIIICSDPNTANRDNLRNYLASKWGITLA